MSGEKVEKGERGEESKRAGKTGSGCSPFHPQTHLHREDGADEGAAVAGRGVLGGDSGGELR